jgi:hypothetical protein
LPDASVLVLQGFAFVLILASEALRGRMGPWLTQLQTRRAAQAEARAHETSRARLAREQAEVQAALSAHQKEAA